jgi:hypothetical protein
MALGAPAGSRAEEALASSNSAPYILFASIWAYALASGLIAFGLTEIIAAIVRPGSLRLSLQMAAIPVVAGTAGIACERTLTALRSLVASRNRK